MTSLCPFLHQTVQATVPRHNQKAIQTCLPCNANSDPAGEDTDAFFFSQAASFSSLIKLIVSPLRDARRR